MFPSPDWTACHGAVLRPYACRHCLTPYPQHRAHAMFLGGIARPPANAWCPSAETLILRSSVSTINQVPFYTRRWRRRDRGGCLEEDTHIRAICVSNAAIRCGSGAWKQKGRNYGWAASLAKVGRGLRQGGVVGRPHKVLAHHFGEPAQVRAHPMDP